MRTTLTDPAVRAFVTEGTRTGQLAWVSPSGKPLVTPVWFVLDGDRIAFNTGADTSKGRAILRGGPITLSVDLPAPPYAYVQVQGTPVVSEDLAEVRRIATACGARYMGADRGEEFGARNGVPGELAVWIDATRVNATLDTTA